MPLTLGQINPTTVYDTARVAEVAGVTVETVQDWIATKKLLPLRRVGKARYRVLGSAILTFFGLDAPPRDVPSETRGERKQRAERALDDIRRMTKVKS